MNIYKHKIIVDGKEQELIEIDYTRHEYEVVGSLLYRSVKPIEEEKSDVAV